MPNQNITKESTTTEKLQRLTKDTSITPKEFLSSTAKFDLLVGGGNVIDNYSWSVSKTSKALGEVPKIIIQEFQPNLSTLFQAIGFSITKINEAIQGEIKDYYDKLYPLGDSGNTYVLPYYNPYHHQITNTWAETQISQTVNNIATIANAFFPSAGVEKMKAWQGSGEVAYEFTFQLLNTVEKDDVTRNQKFINALIHNNLPHREGYIKVSPPAICKIQIPGMRGLTLGVLSDIIITNTGQLNLINNVNVPDAYNVTIRVTELLAETRQIFTETTDSKVLAEIGVPTVDISNAVDVPNVDLSNPFGTTLA